MHTQANISIMSIDPASISGQALAAAITSCWPTSCPTHCLVGLHDRIDAPLVECCDALLLACGTAAPSPELLMELIALRQTGLPIVVLGGDKATRSACTTADMFVLDAGCQPAAVAGVLAGAVHRTNEVATLLHETGQTRVDHSRINRRLAMLDRELEDAAKLQREYLPDARLSIPGGTVSTLWRPASHVSGDGCAVHQLDASTTLLFLADAIGHGVPAAMLSIMLQRVLLEAVRQQDDSMLYDPAQLLEQMNEALLQRQLGITRFATAACGVFNGDTHELRLASAGHPPLLRSRSNGTIDPLPVGGSLLGVFEDEQFESTVVHLEPGDRVVLYSDGIEEACQEPGDDCGAAGLARCCTEWSCNPDFIEAMERRIDLYLSQQHDEDTDDLTVVCLDIDVECHHRRAA